MIKWEKLGQVFVPSGQKEWMKTHAAVPIAQKNDDNTIKVYFSARNSFNQSRIGWVTLNSQDDFSIVEVADDPMLEPGLPGYFDADGVMGCDLVTINNRKYLYYIGWNTGEKVPFRNAIGLAHADYKEERFIKYSSGPLLDRSIYDPCFVASCCVRKIGDTYYMYYLSCVEWEKHEEVFRHKYHIKIAISDDGIRWDRTGKVAIDFKNADEYAISVPRVHFINGKYRMWYSFRGGNNTYRIGYADSEDAIEWVRKDHLAGINVSKEGWDAEMICYPYIFEQGGKWFMLYNGNGYGKTGFGIAVLDGVL